MEKEDDRDWFQIRAERMTSDKRISVDISHEHANGTIGYKVSVSSIGTNTERLYYKILNTRSVDGGT